MQHTPFKVGFPVGGVNRATSYEAQPEGTTPAAENVWPYHYPGGRVMGGSRPPAYTCDYNGGDPIHWCRAVWGGKPTSGGAAVRGNGVAILASGGVYICQVGASSTRPYSWTAGPVLTGKSFSSASSCTVMNNVLYVADEHKASIWSYDLVNHVTVELTPDSYTDGDLAGTTKGVVPKNCSCICQHSGALYAAGSMAGGEEMPYILYRSAVNDPRNWDYSDPGEGGAFASSGVSGSITEPIIALFDHGYGCLFVCHENSMSVVRGDPKLGGSIISISDFSGPVSKTAICKSASDFTFFLTKEELCAVSPGCGSAPMSMSRYKLPADLAGLEISGGDRASVAYEGRFGGLIILTKRVSTADEVEYGQFFFDLGSQGFWPMSFGTTKYTMAATFAQGQLYNRGTALLLKTSAGKSFDTEKTETITSYVWIGPIPLGDGTIDGMLTKITASLGENSAAVSYDVYVAESAQEAFNSSPVYSGSWDRAGRNEYALVHGRGQTAYVKVSYTGSELWAIESLMGEVAHVASAKVWHDDP